MSAKTSVLAALLAITSPAQAGDSVAELSRDSGLRERNVRMLLGARTPYAEYRCCYSRMLRQFKEAVGEEKYRRLVEGVETPRRQRWTSVRDAGGKDVLDTVEVAAL